jgi:hypothetical protein
MDNSKLGPTGEFPRGPLNDEDEGEINMAVGHTDEGTVFLDFGVRLKWIAMDPEQARGLAKLLSQSASKAEDRAKETAN